jgi:subtilisin family serine protease
VDALGAIPHRLPLVQRQVAAEATDIFGVKLSRPLAVVCLAALWLTAAPAAHAARPDGTAPSGKAAATSSKAPAAGASKASRSGSDAPARRETTRGRGQAVESKRRYIVRFRPGTDARSAAATTGGDVEAVLSHVFPGALVRLPAQAAETLAARNPRVAAVEPDAAVRAVGAQGNATWGLDRIDQRGLPLSSSFSWAGDGAGVTSYVVDSGVRADHVELKGRVHAGFDAFGGSASDCHGHGTHVAGTLAGSTWGVAKATSVVAVKVLDCNGSGSTSGVIAGLDWSVKDHQPGVPAVLNLSLGGGTSEALDKAVGAAVADGITVAVAAGNEGKDACHYSPARAPEALTVGASDKADSKPSWSNWGSCLDVFAPGAAITSATALSTTSTGTWSGTSMAAPHVAGAAAALLSQAPHLTPAQVTARLLDGATLGAVTSGGSGSPNRLLFSSPDAISGDAPFTDEPGTEEPGGEEPPTATVPSAPQSVEATPLRRAVRVGWTPGEDGGSTVTSFTVRVRQGSKVVKTVTVTGTATSTTISGLRAKTAYTFSVSATNAVGTSAETASGTVSPLDSAPAPKRAKSASR